MKDIPKDPDFSPSNDPNLSRELILYFKQGQVELLYEEKRYCLLLVCEGIIEPTDFRLALEKALLITDKHQIRSWIFDLDDSKFPLSQNHFTTSFITKIIKQGLQKILFVVSKELFNEQELIRIEKKQVSDQDLIAYFAHRPKAWAYLTDFFKIQS